MATEATPIGFAPDGSLADLPALETPALYASRFTVIGTNEIFRIVFGENYPGFTKYHTAIAVSPDGAKKLVEILNATIKQREDSLATSSQIPAK